MAQGGGLPAGAEAERLGEGWPREADEADAQHAATLRLSGRGGPPLSLSVTRVVGEFASEGSSMPCGSKVRLHLLAKRLVAVAQIAKMA